MNHDRPYQSGGYRRRYRGKEKKHLKKVSVLQVLFRRCRWSSSRGSWNTWAENQDHYHQTWGGGEHVRCRTIRCCWRKHSCSGSRRGDSTCGKTHPATWTYCCASYIRRIPYRVRTMSAEFVHAFWLTRLSRVTEQPYKIPFYAALLRLLHEPENTSVPPNTPSLGKQILEDFWKGFQAFVDKLAWREARLCVC